jgi:hypothetical protein
MRAEAISCVAGCQQLDRDQVGNREFNPLEPLRQTELPRICLHQTEAQHPRKRQNRPAQLRHAEDNLPAGGATRKPRDDDQAGQHVDDVGRWQGRRH